MPFAANYYSGNGITAAIVNIRFYPDLELTQTDALAATTQDVMELDEALREQISKGIEAIGGNISSWRGTDKNTINGLTVFTTEYRRASLKSPGNFRVRLVRALLTEHSFTMTISYLESQEPLLKLITDRIISSIEVAGIETSQIPKTNNVENEKMWDSVMETYYGENWILGLGISAFITWGIGLTPPLLLRFAILRRPIGKWWAIGTVSILWMVNLLIVVALGSTSKTHTAVVLVAVVSYFILRKRGKQKPQEASN